MAVDITEIFISLVKENAKLNGYDEKEIKNIISNTILPKKKELSPIPKAAAQIKLILKDTKKYVYHNKQVYITPGLLSNEEYREIDKEVALLKKACSEKINELSELILKFQQLSEESDEYEISAQAIAHYHGMVLILTEELKEIVVVYDKCRTERRKNEINEENRRNKQISIHKQKLKNTLPSTSDIASSSSSMPNNSNQQFQQSSILLEEENKALYDHLKSKYDQVQETARKLDEISELNTMLSEQVIEQSYKIEQIYNDAVKSSMYITKGNKELEKTIKLNEDSKWFVVSIIIIAGLLVLYLDWFYS